VSGMARTASRTTEREGRITSSARTRMTQQTRSASTTPTTRRKSSEPAPYNWPPQTGLLLNFRRAEGPGEYKASKRSAPPGATLRQIAATLNREGRKLRRSDVWHAGSLGPIVKRMEVGA
jgi:hypothetical protein